MIKKGLLFFAILCSLQVQAEITAGPRIHHEYESPRALGMGNAFVAVADDYNALFYNPAGMARRKDGHLNLYLGGGTAQDLLGLISDIDKASSKQGSTDAEKQEAILEILNKSYGDSYALLFNAPSGILVRPNWGIGILPLNFNTHLNVHQSLGPVLNIHSYLDTVIAFGLAKDYEKDWLPKGRTSIGVTFKAVNRGYLNESFAAVDLVADSKVLEAKDFKEGFTLDADLGLLYDPEIPEEGFFSVFRLAKPSFGLVVRNIADYGFTTDLNLLDKAKSEEKPERLYRRIDIGSKWEYPELWIFGGRGVLDFRDILHPSVNFRKSLHLGFEFDWKVFSWWKGHYRIGLNQGYLTAGLSALLGIFNLDLVTYAEDVGSLKNPKESRKYELRMNLDF